MGEPVRASEFLVQQFYKPEQLREAATAWVGLAAAAKADGDTADACLCESEAAKLRALARRKERASHGA